MPDTIDQLRARLNQRLGELDQEADSLRAALKALGGAPATRSRKTNGRKASATGSPTAHVAEGTLEKVLRFAEKEGDITVADTTKHLKVHSNTTRNALRILVAEGRLQHKGRGDDRRDHYSPITAAEESVAA